MQSRLIYRFFRLRERLWVRPLLNCIFAVLAVFLAQAADHVPLNGIVPKIAPETIEKLLTIISSSMLAVATFAVGSMVSAYASASSSATPRAFALVLADDTSQNALSSFIGAFIFSIVGLIALKAGLYGVNGNFALFALTLALFAWVVATFVRWVDNIARLGRMEPTMDKAEAATEQALRRRWRQPALGGVPLTGDRDPSETPVHSAQVGYVQHIDMEKLQAVARAMDTTLTLTALPGTFLTPDRPIARVALDGLSPSEDQRRDICATAIIGTVRTFEDDPRFGMVVLSEIASRALSPGINDPGTAIAILGRFVRLFSGTCQNREDDAPEVRFDRIRVPLLQIADLFDDAFTAIARDGAGTVEVGIRLQKTFLALAATGDPAMAAQARRHSALALARAETALPDQDLGILRALAAQVTA